MSALSRLALPPSNLWILSMTDRALSAQVASTTHLLAAYQGLSAQAYGLSQERDTLLASQAPEDFPDLTSTFDLSAAKIWMNEYPLMSSRDSVTMKRGLFLVKTDSICLFFIHFNNSPWYPPLPGNSKEWGAL